MRITLYLSCLILLAGCASDAGMAATGTTSTTAQPMTGIPTDGETYVPGELESPNIKVTVSGAPAGQVLLVGQYTDQQFQAMDAQADANGTVVFQQQEALKPGFYFAYYQDGTAAQMLISEDQTFELATDKNDIAGAMTVTGSDENQLLYDGLKFEVALQPDLSSVAARLQNVSPGQPLYESLTAERQALIDRRTAYFEKVFAENPKALYTQYKRAGQNPEIREVRDGAGNIDEQGQVTAFRYDFWDNVNFNDPRLLRTPVIANKLKRYIGELTPQNADSIIAAADYLMRRVLDKPPYYEFFANYITLQYPPGESPIMDAEAIHVNMIHKYFTQEKATWSDSMQIYGLRQRADQMANSLVGQQGPNITVPGIDGKAKTLYDLDAPYLIVYMYNPECEHCIEETPRLVNWWKNNKQRADVFAVALDTEDDKWKNFVRNYGLQEWTNVHDPTNRSIFKTYYVDNTPELYLLDKDRKIVAKNIKPAQLDQAIQIVESK